MKTTRLRPFLFLVLTWTMATSFQGLTTRAATASPPTKISHQGFLTDSTGAPLGKDAPVNKTVSFKIFLNPTGGSSLWTSSQTATVDKGYFSVILGEGTVSLGSDLGTVFSGPEASDRYLELEVDGATLSPRLRFLATPYALLATKAMTLDANATFPADKLTGNLPPERIAGLDASKINANQFATDRIPPLNASKITSGKFDATTFLSGTVPDSLLSANVAKLDSAQTFSGTKTFASGVFGSAMDGATHATVNGFIEIKSTTASPTQLGGIKFMDDATEKGALAVAVFDGAFSPGAKPGDVVLRATGTTNNLILRAGVATTTPAITITSDNRVGIGVTSPKAPLHVMRLDSSLGVQTDGGKKGVEGNLTSSKNNVFYLGADAAEFNQTAAYGGSGDNFSITNGYIAALFEGDIIVQNSVWASSGVKYASDARAKRISGQTDGRKDLERLQQLSITDFTWIDQNMDGRRPHKMLIAQELEKVFPQAVSIRPMPTAIPNVYEKANSLRLDAGAKLLWLTTAKAHDFKVGDQVDVYTDKVPMKEVRVEAISSAHEFAIACDQAPQSAFVYGKYVNDFRTVDYDAIAMLNVSATQELARQNESLRRRVAELESGAAQIAALQRRVNELEGLEREMADLRQSVRQLTARQGARGIEGDAATAVAAVLPISSR